MARSRHQRETLAALGFLAPNFIGFFLFVSFPVLASIVLLLTNWSLKPAVGLEFVGLDNVWQLIGFRPIPDVEPSGGLVWICGFLGAWTLLGAGIVQTMMDMGRNVPGLRLGGWLLVGMAGLLVVGAFAQFASVGAALLGVMMLFWAFFMVTNDDRAFAGRGVVGPGLFTAGMAGIFVLWGPTLARWEPLDANFYFYLYNTLYLMVAIPVTIAGSLALALLLSEPLLGKTSVRRTTIYATLPLAVGAIGGYALWFFVEPDYAVLWVTFWGIAALGLVGGVTAFRTLFYIPTFTAGIAVMLLWKQLFNPTFGPLNEGLRVIFGMAGIAAEPPTWLSDPDWAKPALMLMGFWIAVGGQNMLLYLAGLSNIPTELYEAGRIDGANKVQLFWNVTWPQLAPTTFFIVIMSTILGLQGGFEQARVMTQGGPAGSTKTLAYYVYEKAFEELSLGYASGIAWVLFLMVFVLTALNWRFGNRYVTY